MSIRHHRRSFRRSWTPEEAELVAVEGRRVIGHLNVSREESPVTRHVASLGMSVAADRRGKGVGSALLEGCIRWAKTVGVEKLALSVYPDNDRALRHGSVAHRSPGGGGARVSGSACRRIRR